MTKTNSAGRFQKSIDRSWESDRKTGFAPRLLRRDGGL